MVNFVSPGVYTIEKDISEYTPSINTSVFGIVGFASKGPVNIPTLITNQNNLIRTFGSPSETIQGQALEGALEILEETNSLYFIRSATSTATEANRTLPLGGCPVVILRNVVDAGITQNVTLRIQVYDNNGVAQFTDNDGAGKDFTIASGIYDDSNEQGLAVKSVIGGSLDADKVFVLADGPTSENIPIVGAFAGENAYIAVSAVSALTFDPNFGISGLRATLAPSSVTDFGVSGATASAIRSYGSTFLAEGTNSVGYKVESLYPGAGYNLGTKSDGTTSGNSVTVSPLGNKNVNLIINDEGFASENFKVSLASLNFIEDIINKTTENITSEYIKGNLVYEGTSVTSNNTLDFSSLMSEITGETVFSVNTKFLDPQTNPDGTGSPTSYTRISNTGGRFNKLIQAVNLGLSGGDSGIGTENENATALIGDSSQDPKTGMQALDDRSLNIGVALVPGITNQNVQNSLITLAETTQDFLALIAPPYGLNTQQAIDWTNGKSLSRTSAVNNSYAAVYWPWVKVFNTFDGKDIWYDPTIFAARQMAFTDSIADSWFAPAGFQRGRLAKPTEVEVKLNQGDRDSLYSGGNIINPIVSFPQQGITIFGQRTTQREASALDRINVRRLMIYIRKVILLSAQRFVFEPNDEFTWASVETVINPFLDDIKRRRGITEFRVVCDETTNTPVRVDRNELWCKVILRPTKTAEIIVFEINLTNQSADLGTI